MSISTKTTIVLDKRHEYMSASQAHEALQYNPPSTPLTNCICLLPVSRSLRSGVTKAAAAKANGISRKMDENTAWMLASFFRRSFERGRD